MSDLDYFVADEHLNPSSKANNLEFLTQRTLPSLLVIATILGIIKHVPESLLWSLFGVTMLSFAVSFMPSIKGAYHARTERIRDREATRRYVPQLRKLGHRFQDFVTNSKPDTLHWMTQSLLCEGHGAKLAKLAMPDMSSWTGRADFFCRRLDRKNLTRDDLQLAVSDFYDMVGTYINQCVTLVFDRLPQDLMTTMTPRAKSSLASFQQRFEIFQTDTEQLLKEISESRPSLENVPRCFASVRPLP